MICCPANKTLPSLWQLAKQQLPQGPVEGKNIRFKDGMLYRKLPAGCEIRYGAVTTQMALPVQVNGSSYEVVFEEDRGKNYPVTYYNVQLFQNGHRLAWTLPDISGHGALHSTDETKMDLFDTAIRTALNLPPQKVFKFVPMFPWGATLL